jgi:hypothetical protein
MPGGEARSQVGTGGARRATGTWLRYPVQVVGLAETLGRAGAGVTDVEVTNTAWPMSSITSTSR